MEEEKQDRLEKLLEEHLEQNKKILETVERTRRFMNYLRVVNLIKLVVIIVPIIFALIYVPPFLQHLIDAYEEIIGTSPFKILQDIKNGE